MTNKSADLSTTMEELRKQRYPDLPAGLVAAILRIEAECADDRAEARRRINQAVEEQIEEESSHAKA